MLDWLRRLFGGHPALSVTTVPQPPPPAAPSGPKYDVHIVGEFFRADVLADLLGDSPRMRCTVELTPEPDNPHDPNAVKATINTRHVGYLSRSNALRYVDGLARHGRDGEVIACQAIVEREDSPNSQGDPTFNIRIQRPWPLTRGAIPPQV